MARTLKQLDAFANALKKRLDAHDALHKADPLHSHAPAEPPHDPPPVEPPPVEPPPPPPPPVDPPPVEPPPTTGAITIGGFGAHALDGLPIAVTLVRTAAEFLTAYSKLGQGVSTIRFPVGLTATWDLGQRVNRIDGRANFLIDGRGANVTFVNGPLWFEGCRNFALVNLRHRGGWKGGQSADGITFAGGCHDYAAVNVSVSGAADEGMSSTRSCWNYTYQDCLWGPGQSGHNYGSLNDYKTDRGSHIRPTFVGLNYRCPKIGYHGDSNSGSRPANITADVVNRVCVDCDYGLTAHSGALVNDTNPYNQNVGDPVDGPAHGAVIGGHPVPDWAKVPAMSPDAAARYAKANAGHLPHDAFDQALLGRIEI